MSEEAEPRERTTVGGVFGVTLGLGLFAAAIVVILLTRATPLESSAEVWSQHFASDEPPTGYEFSGASQLLEGRIVVKLLRSGDERSESAAQAEGELSTGGDEEPKHTDWSKVVEDERDTPPTELTFLFYPRGQSQLMFQTYFRDLPRRGLDELDGKGGSVIIESGELDWKGFRTNYVRQRRYRLHDSEPNFIDSLRVNLSVGQSCVLVAVWPRGFPSGVKAVEALLAEVDPLTSPG